MYLRIISKALLVLAALLFLADQAAACTCSGLRQDKGFHPCMAYSRADVGPTPLFSQLTARSEADS